MSDKTHVPDKLHGYTLQVRHMLYELISLDLDKIVSIEISYEDARCINKTYEKSTIIEIGLEGGSYQNSRFYKFAKS